MSTGPPSLFRSPIGPRHGPRVGPERERYENGGGGGEKWGGTGSRRGGGYLLLPIDTRSSCERLDEAGLIRVASHQRIMLRELLIHLIENDAERASATSNT